MYMTEFFIVFPEGDTQEINGRLRLNEVVDVNGNPMSLPLKSNKIAAFIVNRISTKDYKGGSEIYHYLEQLSAQELMEYVRR